MADKDIQIFEFGMRLIVRRSHNQQGIVRLCNSLRGLCATGKERVGDARE